MGNTPQERLAALEAERERLAARLQRWQARADAEARRQQAKRRAIMGDVMEWALLRDGSPEGRAALLLLDRALVRPTERSLFGLPPRASDDTDSSPTDTGG
jgi:hypothetical protein